MVKLFTQNKKVLILAMGIGLFLSLVPFYFAEAFNIAEWCECVIDPPGPLPPIPSPDPVCWIRCVAGFIFSLPIRIIAFMFAGIFGILALILGIIYGLSVALLNWLIGIIMSVGIVPGRAPVIVEMGWDFSRQFANMFFVLALAFIGLATILRIKDYEAKKALPILIIIALLINFTPVIVGFIVDMGNLVTKFFLDRMGGGTNFFLTILETTGNYLTRGLLTIFIVDGQFLYEEHFGRILGTIIGITIYGLVLVIFFAFATFIYFLIGAVFFCRTLILWVLMILSPIAFLSKVFPDTRTTKMIFPDILHWDKWWQTLIQWTIIGIPISFFLYLSNSVIIHSRDFETIFNPAGQLEENLRTVPGPFSPGLTGEFIDLFTALLAPTISLMLLAMGALISFKAVPEGAKGIMRFATEKGVKRAWPQLGMIRATKAGLTAMWNLPETYRGQIRRGATRRGAFFRTVASPARAFWQKRQPPSPPSTPPSPPATAPATPTAPAQPSPTPSTVSHAEEIGDEEEASAEEFHPPAPTIPTVSRKKRVAKWIGKWGVVVPAKIAYHSSLKILQAAENTAIGKIEKEMGIGKDKEEGKKTINCPLCSKKIPADSKFCPYCREKIE